MKDLPKPVPPLSQSRQADMACQCLYVCKHVVGGPVADSEAAARGTEVHQILATYINHLVRTRRSTDLGYLDCLITGTASSDVYPALERFREHHAFDPEEVLGTDLQKISKYEMALQLPNTHLSTLEVYDGDRPVSFPVRFDRGFSLDKTNLLARMVEVWGEIPIALIQHLDVRYSLYGYIGLQDFTLHPMLRPGSFVQIDPDVRKIHSFQWRTEFDRPTYFLELRDSYACARLSLTAIPTSRQP